MEYLVLRQMCQNAYARCDLLNIEWLTSLGIIVEFGTVKVSDQYLMSELQWVMDV